MAARPVSEVLGARRKMDSNPQATLSARLSDALLYAAALHARQRRKLSGEPYLAHLLATASLVMEYGGSEEEIIAALLHDAVEDQGGGATLEAIRLRFGDAVAGIVESCSDAMDSPKPPWRQRKESHVARLAKASDSVRLVAAADKLHNVRALLREYRRQGEAVWGFFRGGRDGTLWYYRAVVGALLSPNLPANLSAGGNRVNAAEAASLPVEQELSATSEPTLRERAAISLVLELERAVLELAAEALQASPETA